MLALLLLLSRIYWPVAIADMPQNVHTHVQVTGTVAYVKQEGDGDTHIRLVDDAKHFIVAECIPLIPCVAPKVGQKITVKGISRYDGKHKWYECNPVEVLTTP